MVRNPTLPKELHAEAIIPLRQGMALGIQEGMRRGAEADHRATRLRIVQNHLELILGQCAEACELHHQVCSFERFEPRNVGQMIRRNEAMLVLRIENRRAASVLALQKLGEQRHGFFRTIFLIASDEDHVGAGIGLLRREGAEQECAEG